MGLFKIWFEANDQEWFYRKVRHYADQFEQGHPASGQPEDFVWHLDGNFPLNKIAGTKSAWIKFINDEEAAWENEGEPDRYKGLESDQKPIILVNVDGTYYVWDGNHRIAARHRANMPTIPAIIGERYGKI